MDGHYIRLIPAHAGSTVIFMLSPFLRRAHPRSRGEHALRALQFGHMFGSSPLTRGAHFQSQMNTLSAGLIPAHAGSTYGPC